MKQRSEQNLVSSPSNIIRIPNDIQDERKLSYDRVSSGDAKFLNFFSWLTPEEEEDKVGTKAESVSDSYEEVKI